MLGSTGSGKTVMAKALIEEAALAGIPALIIDPQGDLARLALGIDESELLERDGDVDRKRKLLENSEVRIWTPLRSKGLPLCIDPFRAPPADLDPEEAITAWDMVAAGFTSLAGYDVEKAQGKLSNHSCTRYSLKEHVAVWMLATSNHSLAWFGNRIMNSRDSSILTVSLRTMRRETDVPSWDRR